MRCPKCGSKYLLRSHIVGSRICDRCEIRFDIKTKQWTKIVITKEEEEKVLNAN
uniref:Putative transcription factor TFIIB zinc-binding motif n=1 Tax=viral metagenome TaxID=1070528 RepID=A0A6M3X668_9ZZZZ